MSEPDPASPAPGKWLVPEVLDCPRCGARLYSVEHSPFADWHILHCDRCPRSVEVGYYDPAYSRVLAGVGQGPDYFERLMAAIEPRLRACDCGGAFRAEAPRRCFTCAAVVPRAADKGLYPYFGCEDSEADPTPEQQAAFDAFDAAFVRRDGIWRDAG